MRTCTALAVLLVAVASVAGQKDKDKDKPTVKEIPAKDLKVTHPKAGKVSEPAEVKSAEELAKNEVVGKSADEIRKHVDFDKQKLVVFAWSGSGGDVLTASIGADSAGKSIVYVEYRAGRTDDLRRHVRLFAVPKDLKVVVDGK